MTRPETARERAVRLSHAARGFHFDPPGPPLRRETPRPSVVVEADRLERKRQQKLKAINNGRPCACGRPRAKGNTICSQCASAKARLRRYRMEPSAYEALLAYQGGRCAICRSSSPTKTGGSRPWSVDHDHGCCDKGSSERLCGQCNRGLLCQACNAALGIIEREGFDEWLADARRYLMSHKRAIALRQMAEVAA